MTNKGKTKKIPESKTQESCFVSNKCGDADREYVQRKVCMDLPTTEYIGHYYCLLHLPDVEKKDEFGNSRIKEFCNEIHNRLNKIDELITEIRTKYSQDIFNQQEAENKIRYDFQYVWFTYIDFTDRKFNAWADFTSAVFSNGVSFNSTIFSANVFFQRTSFCSVTNFSKTIFMEDAYFDHGSFGEESHLIFLETTFKGMVSFVLTVINGRINFWGSKDNLMFVNNESCLLLGYANISSPEKIIFHTVRVEPTWFIHTDSSGFRFIDCNWNYWDGKNIEIKQELEKLTGTNNSHAILRRARRQLADNYEENKSFGKASRFRQFAGESWRIQNPWYKQPFTLNWWYWLSSFYGESWQRAFLVLTILILVIFPAIYTKSNFQTCSKDRPIAASLTICESKDEDIRKNCTCSTDQITLTDAIVQSLTTATLQNVEYRKPLTVWGELWIILEKIFAPLQAALLALAIRRKFMR